jgi:hypothetical protein
LGTWEPKHSQTAWKKPTSKPNSQAISPKNNPNTKQQIKHKDPIHLGVQLPKPSQLKLFQKNEIILFHHSTTVMLKFNNLNVDFNSQTTTPKPNIQKKTEKPNQNTNG